MVLLLFSLIQSQQPPRLSPLVIAAAVLVFIVGVSLLVYFFRRLKMSEKEADEDWSLSRRSLFVNAEPEAQKSEEVASAEPVPPEPIRPAATEILASTRTGEIQEVTRETTGQDVAATKELRAEYPPPPEIKVAEAPAFQEQQPHDKRPDREPASEALPTQTLASLQPDRVTEAMETIDEPAPFDDGVWDGIDVSQQQSAPPIAAAPDQGTQLLGSIEKWPAPQSPSIEEASEQRTAPRLDARVEGPARRESFEPPVIKPLTPRERSTFMRDQSDSSASHDLYSSDRGSEKGPARGPAVYNARAESEPPEREIRPAAESLYTDAARAAEPSAPSSLRTAPAEGAVEPSLAARGVERAAGQKSRAGSILGLPAEASQGPLILGEPVRSKEERGIGALSNYGRPMEKDGGRGGTIALLAVVLILGGGLLAYLLIPSVNARVNAWVARVRGTDVEEARKAALIPKAVIYPRFNSEVNKNQVKIKGAVDNIWSEPLENLTVEVSLVRGGDAPPQLINVPVSPSPLPANQRGTFDFEYDGKRDTGFTGYKITRLLSNGNEVKFSSPNAQK